MYPCIRGSARWPRAVSGLTLIEVVLVLVVIAVAGIIASPAIGPALDAVRSRAAVRRTAAFLDDARRLAVLERRVLVLRCRLEEGLLELEGGAAGARSFRVPEAVELVLCTPEQVRYHPQGFATGATMMLREKGGRERRLTVGAFTGLARVEAAP